ncbi:MAG: GMC family oxidoreductase N-terminal domain-containing protein [Proteobacteria bacterium]|jgi:choline dehydrogenase-like flavoprotein|nr:GMC family oxidoreductase N-terminal domain-containing protein [Pseudomonadota bacterium]
MHIKEEKDIDFIIVGSGPGGATVAKELSERKKKVLILEWGDNDPLTGSFWYGAKTLLVPGKSILFTKQMLGMVRGITTGGSSVHYYATCYPVPFEMLKCYGIDITEEVGEMRSELPIAPLKDAMIGPMAKRIMESAQDLGYKWQKLEKFMYQDRWKPEHPFGHYGDPHGVKWSARMYIEEAITNGAELIDGAKVTKVIIEDKSAIGVEFTKNGRNSKVFAPKIVISAGGIGTPVIMRASGIKEAGYDFFFDPLIGVRGTVRNMKVPLSEIPMSAGVHMEDEGYMMTDMSHPFATTAIFAAGVFRFDKMFSRRNTLQIMVKAKDELGGKLTDSGGIRKMLDKNEKRKLLRGYERAKEILRNAGAKSIFKTGYLAAHPGGTVKVGNLIDSNLKTEYDNLYVCDCSVIPEAWGLPPTSTIIGLGKRLAKHLSNEVDS